MNHMGYHRCVFFQPQVWLLLGWMPVCPSSLAAFATCCVFEQHNLEVRSLFQNGFYSEALWASSFMAFLGYWSQFLCAEWTFDAAHQLAWIPRQGWSLETLWPSSAPCHSFATSTTWTGFGVTSHSAFQQPFWLTCVCNAMRYWKPPLVWKTLVQTSNSLQDHPGLAQEECYTQSALGRYILLNEHLERSRGFHEILWVNVELRSDCCWALWLALP